MFWKRKTAEAENMESGDMVEPEDIILISQAALFAAHAHTDAIREDSGQPYVNHLAEVAAFCASVNPVDPVLVAAAWLHDVLEETSFTQSDLNTIFGAEVAQLVADVSDPPGLRGRERRERQITHTMECGRRVKLLKLADKTSNIEELIGLPPDRFNLIGNRRYLKWARQVVDVCRGLAPDLEARFDRSAARLETEIVIAEEAAKHSKKKARQKRKKKNKVR